MYALHRCLKRLFCGCLIGEAFFGRIIFPSAPIDRTSNALYPALANSPRLLFPDELYCPRVAVAVFGLNYALASVAFCLAAGVSYKTKSLVSCNATITMYRDGQKGGPLVS